MKTLLGVYQSWGEGLTAFFISFAIMLTFIGCHQGSGISLLETSNCGSLLKKQEQLSGILADLNKKYNNECSASDADRSKECSDRKNLMDGLQKELNDVNSEISHEKCISDHEQTGVEYQNTIDMGACRVPCPYANTEDGSGCYTCNTRVNSQTEYMTCLSADDAAQSLRQFCTLMSSEGGCQEIGESSCVKAGEFVPGPASSGDTKYNDMLETTESNTFTIKASTDIKIPGTDIGPGMSVDVEINRTTNIKIYMIGDGSDPFGTQDGRIVAGPKTEFKCEISDTEFYGTSAEYRMSFGMSLLGSGAAISLDYEKSGKHTLHKIATRDPQSAAGKTVDQLKMFCKKWTQIQLETYFTAKSFVIQEIVDGGYNSGLNASLDIENRNIICLMKDTDSSEEEGSDYNVMKIWVKLSGSESNIQYKIDTFGPFNKTITVQMTADELSPYFNLIASEKISRDQLLEIFNSIVKGRSSDSMTLDGCR